jgi:hypothetical protein
MTAGGCDEGWRSAPKDVDCLLLDAGEAYMICPRCQQDDVVKAMIKANKTIIFICPECEATWFSIEKITFPGFVDYMTYMEGIGLSHLWDELEVISEDL